ncbi:MAG: hypothetical protein LUG83_05665 [Lachnospiraceae bacterium]|nr:hypothetical protein [Lachnospiraceae bacterium]
MSKEERKETVERIAEKFASLQDNEKSFIAGYMARAEEDAAGKKRTCGYDRITVKRPRW